MSQDLPNYWDRVWTNTMNIEIKNVNYSDEGRYTLRDRGSRVVSVTRMDLTGWSQFQLYGMQHAWYGMVAQSRPPPSMLISRRWSLTSLGASSSISSWTNSLALSHIFSVKSVEYDVLANARS